MKKKNESAFATFGNLRFCMSVISHPAYSNNCVYHYGFYVKIPPNYIYSFVVVVFLHSVRLNTLV